MRQTCSRPVLWVREMYNTPLIKRLRPGFCPKFESYVNDLGLCSQSVLQVLSYTSSTPLPSSLDLCVAATSIQVYAVMIYGGCATLWKAFGLAHPGCQQWFIVAILSEDLSLYLVAASIDALVRWQRCGCRV